MSQEAPFVRRSAFRFFLFPPPPDSVVIDSPPPTSSPSPDTAKAPSPEPLASTPSPSPVTPISPSSVPSPAEGPGPGNGHSRRHHHRVLILSVATVGPILLLLIVGVFFWQSGKVSTVKPWATGISGQLQRAFVTGNSYYYASPCFSFVSSQIVDVPIAYRPVPFSVKLVKF